MKHGTPKGYSKYGCRCEECREANSACQKRYYARNKERLVAVKRERARASRAADPEKYRAQQNARRAADREKFRELNRGYRVANPEKYRAYARAARAANPEKMRQYRRDHYAANREHIQQVTRDYDQRTGNACRSAQRRRARMRGAFIEDVDPLVVFERDDYICQECGQKCQRDEWPARDYATVDHIVALINGGEHSYANTQTLCFKCNTSKGAARTVRRQSA